MPPDRVPARRRKETPLRRGLHRTPPPARHRAKTLDGTPSTLPGSRSASGRCETSSAARAAACPAPAASTFTAENAACPADVWCSSHGSGRCRAVPEPVVAVTQSGSLHPGAASSASPCGVAPPGMRLTVYRPASSASVSSCATATAPALQAAWARRRCRPVPCGRASPTAALNQPDRRARVPTVRASRRGPLVASADRPCAMRTRTSCTGSESRTWRWASSRSLSPSPGNGVAGAARPLRHASACATSSASKENPSLKAPCSPPSSWSLSDSSSSRPSLLVEGGAAGTAGCATMLLACSESEWVRAPESGVGPVPSCETMVDSTTLGGGTSPLRGAVAADNDRRRTMASTSPTCSGATRSVHSSSAPSGCGEPGEPGLPRPV